MCLQDIVTEIRDQTGLQPEANLEPVHGGDISPAFRIRVGNTSYFLKYNNENLPGLFEKESVALGRLAATSTIPLPAVIGYFEKENHQWLLLEWIEQGKAGESDWQTAGKQLAMLHRNTRPQYGLDHDNYIGSLLQHNPLHDTWAAFYAEARLLPMAKQMADRNVMTRADLNSLEKICGKLSRLFPDTPPSLLHGDLWGGNILPSGKGVYFIDPSIYYGNREMDLAMCRLFGGFDPRFYVAYEEEFPLEKGWKERIRLCQLYPMLVHLAIFGSTYLERVRSIIREYA